MIVIENTCSRSILQTENQLFRNDQFFELRDIIYKNSGIYFNDNKKYLLEGRVTKRLVANYLNSVDDYIKLIKSPEGKYEKNLLIDSITINETYFFRAEQQFNSIENEIIPDILKHRSCINNNSINIWSAASSTGEEPYSLGIFIKERIQLQYPGITFKIVASDINREVLETARKGIYREYSVKTLTAYYLNKYFTRIDGAYHLSDEIKKMVRFVQINLYDNDLVRNMNYFDMIFCANVLIYFDAASKEKVVSNLYDSLNGGGYLMIGCSESLHGVTKAFRLMHLKGASVYKKE
ncbi:MAG: protein-glutamate O-methyltransferase CheR [FCB group bacterium]|jgi:chemotaxis protein methyltransferase CheR